MKSIVSLLTQMVEDTQTLIDISESLVQLGKKMSMNDIADKMKHRESILMQVQSNWDIVKEALSHQSPSDIPEDIRTLSGNFKQKASQFATIDQELKLMFEDRINMTGQRLSDLRQAISLINKYIHVQKSTDVISRMFTGNSRKFDRRL